MDKDIEKILKDLKKLSNADLVEYSKAYLILNNLDDAAMLTFEIDGHCYDLPLIHVEVIQAFNEFLQTAIDYYREETE